MDETNQREKESGQAVTEYLLLLAVVVSAFWILSRGVAQMEFSKKMMKPLTGNFARAYRHGHPEAKSFEDGGPYRHPRGPDGRMFVEVPQ